MSVVCGVHRGARIQRWHLSSSAIAVVSLLLRAAFGTASRGRSARASHASTQDHGLGRHRWRQRKRLLDNTRLTHLTGQRHRHLTTEAVLDCGAQVRSLNPSFCKGNSIESLYAKESYQVELAMSMARDRTAPVFPRLLRPSYTVEMMLTNPHRRRESFVCCALILNAAALRPTSTPFATNGVGLGGLGVFGRDAPVTGRRRSLAAVRAARPGPRRAGRLSATSTDQKPKLAIS